MEFEDHETYYASLNTQGSVEWKKLRVGRITMSNISGCVGRASYYCDKNELARKICGLIKKDSYLFDIQIESDKKTIKKIVRGYEKKRIKS
jgi:hypothetical protein